MVCGRGLGQSGLLTSVATSSGEDITLREDGDDEDFSRVAAEKKGEMGVLVCRRCLLDRPPPLLS